jgi:hypothetical protein
MDNTNEITVVYTWPHGTKLNLLQGDLNRIFGAPSDALVKEVGAPLENCIAQVGTKQFNIATKTATTT